MQKKIFLTLVLLLFLTHLAGCGAYLKRNEMEKVAKDWALVIRASQVIPVYPLTEDLQPGDVFLVLTPIQKQADQYSNKGFLPLDQHMTRLSNIDYQGFYQKSFGTDTHSDTPHHWQFPKEEEARRNKETTSGTTEHLAATDWKKAPRAAFPTYAFSVKSGAGIQVAIPIQGIPIGLSLMKTDSATGAIAIADTYTYGIPFDQLVEKIRVWALNDHIKEMLGQLREKTDEGIYLRVVNRVYLTGRVVVELYNTEGAAGKVTGGQTQDISIPGLKENDTVANYTSGLKALSSAINASLPGGEIKLAWATNRSVALSETFDRPLVIGYMGFDFPILKYGDLGAPVATLDQLEGKNPPIARLGEPTDIQSQYVILLHAVKALDPQKQKSVCDHAAGMIGGEFLKTYEGEINGSASPSSAFESAGRSYQGKHKPTDNTIRRLYVPLREAWMTSRK